MPTRTSNASADQATKSRMLLATSKLLQTQGYHGTGLNQILADADAPRGSMYFHFPGGKEQLAASALEKSEAWVTRALSAAFERCGDDVAAGLRAIIETFALQLERSNFAEGCPFATVALESSGLPKSLRQACGDAFGHWHAILAERLLLIERDVDRAASLATLVLAAIEGAMVLSKAHADATPLRHIAEQLDALLSR
jgi:TetR/AcrR family transcriptional regulator, lmrAB and yxaGH operons repressor